MTRLKGRLETGRPSTMKGANIMNKNIFILNQKRLPAAQTLVGMGLIAILATVIVLAVGTASAADNGTKSSGILLATKDIQKADAAKKDAKVSDSKAAKNAKAKAPIGPPPSKFWIVNTMRANPALVIFLTLAIGYSVGSIKFGSFSLGAVTTLVGRLRDP